MSEHPSALHLIAKRMEGRIRPMPYMAPADWMASNLILWDGEKAGEAWDPTTTPQLVQIADCLSPDHPSTVVTMRKSQQVGASLLAIGWQLYLLDRYPANMMMGLPGKEVLRDFNAQKVGPAIDAWQRKMAPADRPIASASSKPGESSSAFFKKNRKGGFLFLANANKALDLSSKTIQFGVKDEVDKWLPLSNGSDPHVLFWGRFTVFRKRKNFKIFQLGTPEITGSSEIDDAFEAGDQRWYRVACPSCGGKFTLDFDHFQYNDAPPYNTVHVNPCCGYPMTEPERIVAIDKAGVDGWEITRPEPGREPSFHLDGFSSKFVSMDDHVADFLKARGSELRMKDFTNLNRGRSYEVKGDAPDHVKLMARRSPSFIRGHVPARALILVAAADVQMRGIWLEILGIAPDRQSYVVDALYLDGDTSSPTSPVFDQLRRETLDRAFPDAFGGTRRIDALGIDSGYRSHVVYSWVRRNQTIHPDTGRDLVLALKGLDDWGRPPLGQPSLVDIDLDGQKIRKGAAVWGVGSWPLKAALYSDLHKDGVATGAAADPEGYCHFGTWLDEVYFRQLTSEYLTDEVVRSKTQPGKTRRVWGLRPTERDNHLLDCRIYNIALAEYLGLSTMTEAEWRILALRRGVPAEATEANLFTRPAPAPDTAASETAEEPKPAENLPEIAPEPPKSGWIGAGRTKNWFGR